MAWPSFATQHEQNKLIARTLGEGKLFSTKHAHTVRDASEVAFVRADRRPLALRTSSDADDLPVGSVDDYLSLRQKATQ